MGCFSDVDIRIDTATGGGPDDYEVTFQVTELRRARGTINTMVGNQEGSLLTGLAAPNLLGTHVLASNVKRRLRKDAKLKKLTIWQAIPFSDLKMQSLKIRWVQGNQLSIRGLQKS